MKILPGLPNFSFRFGNKPWKWLIGVVVTLLLIYANVFIYEELTKLPPKEAVQQGLSKTMASTSYSYRAVAMRTLDGKESVISDVSGEKYLQDVHIKGSLPIIKAEVEVYQVGDTMYRRDVMTHGWLVVPGNGRASMEELIAEINPLGAFHFSSDFDVRYVGREKVDRQTCRVYEIMTRGQNKFLELYWQDFNYRVWIDRGEGLIRKAEITAEHRDDPRHLLKVSIELKDFNKPLEIKAPVTK